MLGVGDVIFEDYSVKVKGAIDDKIDAVLEECAGEIIAQTKRNTRVDTGKTKNSFSYKIIGSFLAGHYEAVMGSPDENAIWEEFGTGEHALNGDGRKGGWAYEDRKTGETIWTKGKKPSRAFYTAYTKLKSVVIKRIQESLKGL